LFFIERRVECLDLLKTTRQRFRREPETVSITMAFLPAPELVVKRSSSALLTGGDGVMKGFGRSRSSSLRRPKTIHKTGKNHNGQKRHK